MANLNQMNGSKPRKESSLKDEDDEKNNGCVLVKRISVVKLNKTTHIEGKNFLHAFNKKSVQNFKKNLKGLVKLNN